jgi:hypothetical protein
MVIRGRGIDVQQVPRGVRRAAYRTLDKLLPSVLVALVLAAISTAHAKEKCPGPNPVWHSGGCWNRLIAPEYKPPSGPVCHSGPVIVPCAPDYDPNYVSKLHPSPNDGTGTEEGEPSKCEACY